MCIRDRFFIRNARAVEAIRVPHPVRGTVSLVEWHMARARNHIHVLEENMALLMEQDVYKRQNWKIDQVREAHNELIDAMMQSYRTLIRFARRNNLSVSASPQDILSLIHI